MSAKNFVEHKSPRSFRLSDTAQSVFETEVLGQTEEEFALYDDEAVSRGVRALGNRLSGKTLLAPESLSEAEDVASALTWLSNYFDSQLETGQGESDRQFLARARKVTQELASRVRALKFDGVNSAMGADPETLAGTGRAYQ